MIANFKLIDVNVCLKMPRRAAKTRAYLPSNVAGKKTEDDARRTTAAKQSGKKWKVEILFLKKYFVQYVDMSRNLVFVYGTLKKGEPNEGWMADEGRGSARLLGRGRTKEKCAN